VIYAEVVVRSPGPFGQAFSYAVPPDMSLAPGDAVVVPFGARSLPGIVVAVADSPAFAGDLRTVERRLGSAPLLSPQHIQLACWLAQRYLAPLPAALSLMLPRGTREAADLIVPEPASAPALRSMIPAGEALRALAAVPRALVGRVLPSVVALLDGPAVQLVQRLRSEHGLTAAGEAVLIEAGVAERCTLPLESPARLPIVEDTIAPARLTGPQQAAVDAISSAIVAESAESIASDERLDGGVFLLHGVTGSGKTEVYLAALEAARAHGKQGLVLVPEIALTPQTLLRFSARFPDRVAVMHGRISAKRHRSQWFGARAGEYDVIVGARSALFTPLPNLGLIVLDEEHEPSYKQSDPAPRYHAREAAVELARLTGAVLVLGSATPDVASYGRARRGVYHLAELPSRVVGRTAGTPETVPMPRLEVVDMARELREGNPHVLSRSLDAGIAETLAAGEQTLLFLNRRGTASLLLCRDCGYAPRCPRCSVAYALHLAESRLICHQCYHSRGIPPRCPKCRGARFRPVGLGTQRLEQLIRERFPSARVLRWDGDTSGTQARHAEMARTVQAREVDIVVGTQIVAKGHDFGGITLAGVVSADLSLNVPDFRAAERTFQLLVQVAGRAGRRDRPGRVVIQTYAPGHYAVRAAATSDYAGFYARELAFRRELAYPPVAPLIRLVLAVRNEAAAETEAKRYASQLVAARLRLGLSGCDVAGPAPCYFSKINGRWRWQILLRGSACRELLAEAPPPARWAVDVDPVDVL